MHNGIGGTGINLVHVVSCHLVKPTEQLHVLLVGVGSNGRAAYYGLDTATANQPGSSHGEV